MNFRAIVFFLTISSCVALDPREELNRRLHDDAERARRKSTGVRAADELFSMPNWSEEMASTIATVVEASRYNGPLKEKEAEAERLEAIQPESPEARKAREQAMRELVLLRNKDGAKYQLRELLESLQVLRDKRVVPLIAPVLQEDTWGRNFDGEFIRQPQAAAAEALSQLARKGVISGDKDKYDFLYWRKWWQDNRADFDPVPEPLRAIDAGQGSATLKRSPPATTLPSATPQPSQPKSEPSSAAQPSVAKTGQKQWGLFAAILVVLLALGIWAFAKNQKAR